MNAPAHNPYAGVWTALITPFRADGALDEAALRRIVSRQAAAGIAGVAPTGTTGESPTTTAEEDRRIFELAVESAEGRVKVMAGTGSNCTEHAVDYTRAAKESGADCCLVVSPYYNKPTNAGLKAHYWKVADVGLPVIVYNIKSRTGQNIETDTLMELAAHEMIVGVKEASGDLAQIKAVLAARPPGFATLSGDDALTLDLIKAGGDGVVSVAANIAPDLTRELTTAALAGDWARAEAQNERLSALFEGLFIETNPAPVKYCAHRMGLCELSYRLPMCPPTADSRRFLDGLLSDYGLVK